MNKAGISSRHIRLKDGFKMERLHCITEKIAGCINWGNMAESI